MEKKAFEPTRVAVVLLVCLLVAVTAFLLPTTASKASLETEQATPQKTETASNGLPNFDVREDAASDSLAAFRASVGKDASTVADQRDSIVRGEESLRGRMPEVVVEYSGRLDHAEVVSPNVWKEDVEPLTQPNSQSRPEILRNFLKENRELFGTTDNQIDDLVKQADYTNPDGNLSFVHLEQQIHGVPVFAGEVKAGFDPQGRVIRVVNNLAPGLDYESLSKDFGDPTNAVKAAGRHINHELADDSITLNRKESTELKAVFGRGDWATTAEKMYFPTEPGVAVPAWRVLIWEPVNAYYVIVDASGTMLWRKNIVEDQTQAATYNVYRNANAYIDVAENPAPLTPGPTSPNGAQGSIISRENLTLIGNEGTNSFNNLGWINDGANSTDGNSNQAGIDRDGLNGVDAAQVGSPSRVFSSTWNPPPGNPAPGDEALTAQAQRGAVIQMFYVMNRYHDELYKRGFTEAARNFQNDNFGRGGLGLDRVSSEGQDSSGVNNANFATPADGGRGRMQMYLWTGPTPDRDGTTDADIIIHEVTHGTSNRLHGNGSGLSTNMSRGMGEGWSDFYGHTMLAEPSDPTNGIYTTGGYSLFGLSGTTLNYYYGIRRFPKAVIAFTGANGRPHNALTFRYLNVGCDTLIGTTSTNPNSAFPRSPYIATAGSCDQVHNAGEIWSSALWEVRALMVERLGFTAGTERVLQVVTDGMKLAPIGPTFLQERDAIISAAAAISAADAADVREGFRRRGMGFNASIQSTSPAAVTENYDPWPGGPTPTPTPTPNPTPTPTPVPSASVSGFVTRASNGRGIGGVTVTLQGPSGTQTTSTSGDGGYSFSGVATGFTYTVTPSHNRWTFTPTSTTILVNGTVTGVNFSGTR